MRVAVATAEDGVRLEDHPDPETRRGAILMRVEAALAGECLHDARPPSSSEGPLGRKAVGWIRADGAERRVFAPSRVPCGRCPSCQEGHDAQCPMPTRLTGAMADVVVIARDMAEHGLHDVPEGLPAEAALLAEDLGTVLKARDRLAIRPQETAVVFGVGLLGLLFTRVLSLTGVDVIYTEAGGFRFEVARALGAAETIALDDLDLPDVARRVDLVIQTGAIAHDEALACLPPGGRMAFVGEGVGQSEMWGNVGRLRSEEHWILGSSHPTVYHVAQAMRALAGGLLDPTRLVETIPLDEVPIRLDAPVAIRSLGPRPLVVRP